MDRGKWMITLLLYISVASTASQLDGDGETIALSVWVGQEVDLECADNSSDTIRRLWKREDEIWLFMNEVIVNNNRISSVNSSAIMRIVNVTLDDEGYYTCTAFTRPPPTRTQHLQVKEMPCETPQKPVNGDFESDTDTYRTGDTIRYHCDRGYQLIGQSNRTCTGTIKGWQPQEPYCQPEYIGHIMTRLNGIDNKMTAIEDKVNAIENRITIIENNTMEMEDKISSIDNQSASIESRLTSVVGDVSWLQSFHRLNDNVTKRLIACTNGTKAIDEDTLTKCKTMEWDVRNGQSVSVYTWVVEDFKNKVANEHTWWQDHYSQPFYHTVPGYKFRLSGRIFSHSQISIFLQSLPGEYDDQLRWPPRLNYEVTFLTNVGHEVLYKSSEGEQSTCHFDRPTSPTDFDFDCYTLASNWDNVYINNKHILSDGSVVAKCYFYN